MDSYYSQFEAGLTNYCQESYTSQEQEKSALQGEMNPLDYGISERELESANLEQIKKMISASGCSWNEEQMLLQWRRTLKSRSYTKRCREKNRCQVARMEQEKAALKLEAELLKKEIAKYQKLIQEFN